MEQYDKEYMKMAMLKHEKTFREQVSELHRLYRVQKILMRDVKRSALKRRETHEHQNNCGMGRWDAENKSALNQQCHSHRHQERRRRALDLERPAEEYMEDDCENANLKVEEESEIELTLATGSRRRKKDETSYTSESGASFSSSSTESGGGENLKLQEWGLLQFADVNRRFPGANKGEKESEFNVEIMRQDRLKQPPWLFQCLSLNMT